MSNTIIGRKYELNILEQLLKSTKAEFLALYGRRRVGKTYLIKNFFSKQACNFFYASGIKDAKKHEQLSEFAKQIGKTFYNGAELASRHRWMDALEDLNKAIEQVPEKTKIVVFLDELPWMATPRSGLLEALDYYWNRYWGHNNKLKLVVCGSSASWIIEKIINNKGGLYNRVTRTMCLAPFTLNETASFLNSVGLKLEHKLILELYMVFGGIPHYLALIRKGISAQQAIDELCFEKNSPLVYEFERLFASLFKNATAYIKLIRVIGQHHYGIGQARLLEESKSSDGGRTKQRLTALEQAGFIISFIPQNHKEKGIYYKVIDEFSLFYLYWIEPNLKTILKQDRGNGYWLAKTKSISHKIWAGYAFESTCFKHLTEIRKALHIESGATIGNWRYAATKSDLPGAQIDLLFDREDGVVTICEIKHNEQPFVIDKQYASNLLNKIETYKTTTKTKKQIFLCFITVNGLKRSMYSEEIVSGVSVLNDLFK